MHQSLLALVVLTDMTKIEKLKLKAPVNLYFFPPKSSFYFYFLIVFLYTLLVLVNYINTGMTCTMLFFLYSHAGAASTICTLFRLSWQETQLRFRLRHFNGAPHSLPLYLNYILKEGLMLMDTYSNVEYRKERAERCLWTFTNE